MAQTAVGRPSQSPHPAVVRIIAAEGNVSSLGSGTLVHVTSKHGLVITNWHVVRDATGPVQVLFPDGFRSAGRVMKLDDAWDLAAIGIWRPNARPVEISATAPRPGDILTIAGHGSGQYRAATGRCTQYVAPSDRHPFEMLELSAEARQGDSGGPIFNARGQLAGVLLGAKKGHTVGSFCGRVGNFLADVTPLLNDQQPDDQQQEFVAEQPIDYFSDDLIVLPNGRPAAPMGPIASSAGTSGIDPLAPRNNDVMPPGPRQTVAAIGPGLPDDQGHFAGSRGSSAFAASDPLLVSPDADTTVIRLSDIVGKTIGEQIKSVLACLGGLTLIVSFLRMFKFED